MTVPCPDIATYQLVSGPGGAPILPWVARYAVLRRNPKNGLEWFDFLPMIFQGPSRDSVVGQARLFWGEEQRKIEDTKAKREAALMKARAVRGVNKREVVEA